MVQKMTVEGKVLKWGNSFGIRVNKEVVKKLKLKESEIVELEIRKRENPLIELFESQSKLKITRKEFEENRKLLEGNLDARTNALSRQLRPR